MKICTYINAFFIFGLVVHQSIVHPCLGIEGIIREGREIHEQPKGGGREEGEGELMLKTDNELNTPFYGPVDQFELATTPSTLISVRNKRKREEEGGGEEHEKGNGLEYGTRVSTCTAQAS